MGSNQQTLAFLTQLIELIQERVKYTQRHVGPAWPAGRTLRERIGSCRDLAMLMVACCRVVGLPARFVSGYQLQQPPPKEYDLHAWAEVYLPGAGWRGFDPSAGGGSQRALCGAGHLLQAGTHRSRERQLQRSAREQTVN